MAEQQPQSQPPPESQEPEWPTVAEQQQAAQTSPPAPSTPVRDSLAAMGLDVSVYDNDESLVQDIATGYEASKQAPPPEQLEQFRKFQPTLQEYAEKAPQFNQWLQEQEAAKERTPEPAKPKWGAPQIGDRTSQWLDQGAFGRTEDGKIGVINALTQKYEYDPRYASEIREAEQYLDWQQTAGRRIATDPLAVLKEAGLEDEIRSHLSSDEYRARLRDELRDEIKKDIQSDMENQRLESERRAYIQENTAKFFQTDEKGNVLYTMQEGQQRPVLSETGHAYEQAIHIGQQQFGITDENKLHEFALYAIEHQTQPAEASAPARQIREVKQQTFLEEARKRNGRQAPANRVFPDERNTTVATEAVRESARDNLTDDGAWDEALKEAVQDVV